MHANKLHLISAYLVAAWHTLESVWEHIEHWSVRQCHNIVKGNQRQYQMVDVEPYTSQLQHGHPLILTPEWNIQQRGGDQGDKREGWGMFFLRKWTAHAQPLWRNKSRLWKWKTIYECHPCYWGVLYHASHRVLCLCVGQPKWPGFLWCIVNGKQIVVGCKICTKPSSSLLLKHAIQRCPHCLKWYWHQHSLKGIPASRANCRHVAFWWWLYLYNLG